MSDSIKELIAAGEYFPDMKELENVGYCKLCYKEPKTMPQYNRGCLEVPYWGNGQWGQGEDAARKILGFIVAAANARPAIKALAADNERMKAALEEIAKDDGTPAARIAQAALKARGE